MANIIPSEKGKKGKSPEEQERFEFYERLRRGDPSLRVLEESEAAEGLPMVPPPVTEQIVSMKPELSLIDRIGIRRLKVNGPYANIPVEVTGQALPALIAEEAVHVANEPAFALRCITILKYGSMVTCTEELLEDQALFQSWFPAACARRLALQENTVLYTTLAAGGTLGKKLAASHTMTEAQLITAWQVMPDHWRDGASVVMADLTVNALRALLIATPRALASGIELVWAARNSSLLGMPLQMTAYWPPITTSGNDVEFLTFVHPDGVLFAERHGIQIFTDPYGDAANGRTRFFPTARFGIGIGDPLSVVHMTDTT